MPLIVTASLWRENLPIGTLYIYVWRQIPLGTVATGRAPHCFSKSKVNKLNEIISDFVLKFDVFCCESQFYYTNPSAFFLYFDNNRRTYSKWAVNVYCIAKNILKCSDTHGIHYLFFRFNKGNNVSWAA